VDGFGAQDITQSRVVMRPVYGPNVRISRSLVYDLTRTATDQGFIFDWSLSDVPNAAEFTALFAQWRLDGMCITFTWRSANEANPTRPAFTFAIDPFATAAPSSAQEVLERSNRTWTPNAQRTTLQLKCACAPLNLVASTGGAGGLVLNALARPGEWYSCLGQGSALSYGQLLLWIQGWTANSGTISVKQDYMFGFRSPK